MPYRASLGQVNRTRGWSKDKCTSCIYEAKRASLESWGSLGLSRLPFFYTVQISRILGECTWVLRGGAEIPSLRLALI